ncbi:hypothetical protein AYI69_g1718 [Smittium culicis]|uniref:Uncharacterized protein n=1 Tax=Smittium culicis TaxID=133412 RepID=A0A1R1YPH4_9FUNG|nr:hypothetical protein AYI69_g1718 [Smittium culicis]
MENNKTSLANKISVLDLGGKSLAVKSTDMPKIENPGNFSSEKKKLNFDSDFNIWGVPDVYDVQWGSTKLGKDQQEILIPDISETPEWHLAARRADIAAEKELLVEMVKRKQKMFEERKKEQHLKDSGFYEIIKDSVSRLGSSFTVNRLIRQYHAKCKSMKVNPVQVNVLPLLFYRIKKDSMINIKKKMQSHSINTRKVLYIKFCSIYCDDAIIYVMADYKNDMIRKMKRMGAVYEEFNE